MIRVLISTQLRSDANPEHYQRLDARMSELVAESPGFIDATSWTDDEGTAVSMIRFIDRSALRAWRDHPEHLDAQALGQSTFYSSYEVEILEQIGHYGFKAPDVRWSGPPGE